MQVEPTELTGGHPPVGQIDQLGLELLRLDILPDYGSADPCDAMGADRSLLLLAR